MPASVAQGLYRLAIALVIIVNAVSSGVQRAQASVLGSVYGVGTDITVTQTPTAPVTVSVISLAVGLAVLGGLLAGLLGRWRASRLRPAEALRSINWPTPRTSLPCKDQTMDAVKNVTTTYEQGKQTVALGDGRLGRIRAQENGFVFQCFNLIPTSARRRTWRPRWRRWA